MICHPLFTFDEVVGANVEFVNQCILYVPYFCDCGLLGIVIVPYVFHLGSNKAVSRSTW